MRVFNGHIVALASNDAHILDCKLQTGKNLENLRLVACSNIHSIYNNGHPGLETLVHAITPYLY